MLLDNIDLEVGVNAGRRCLVVGEFEILGFLGAEFVGYGGDWLVVHLWFFDKSAKTISFLFERDKLSAHSLAEFPLYLLYKLDGGVVWFFGF